MGKPYTALAQIYDELMDVVDYNNWIHYLQQIMEFYKFQPESILDLACGTGNITYRLVELGYRVWGVDISDEMLKKAERKREKTENPRFLQGDMRKFSLPEKVDMVISLYDSVNYLLTPGAVEQMAGRAKKVLRPGGLFVFDFNTRARIRKIRPGVHLFEGSNYSCFWEDKVDLNKDRWKVELTIFLRENEDKYYRYQEVHEEQGYGKMEMVALMGKAGFIVEDVFRAYSLSSGEEDDERLYLINRKPPTKRKARKNQ